MKRILRLSRHIQIYHLHGRRLFVPAKANDKKADLLCQLLNIVVHKYDAEVYFGSRFTRITFND